MPQCKNGSDFKKHLKLILSDLYIKKKTPLSPKREALVQILHLKPFLGRVCHQLSMDAVCCVYLEESPKPVFEYSYTT